jgi:hypothetical protein
MRLPYSQPVEVDAEEMGSFGNQAFAERRLFYEDVIRRLEQTTSDKALRYEFKDKKTAENWRASVVNRANKTIGKKTVRTRLIDGGERAHVYFSRGPKWDQR